MTTLRNFEDWPEDRPYAPPVAEWKYNLTRLKNPDGAVDPHNLNGTLTITTSGLSPGMNATQSGSGTASYTVFPNWPYAGFAYNYRLITDQIKLADDSIAVGRGVVIGDVVDVSVGGSQVNGARIAHGAFLRALSPVATGANFMGASWHFAQSVAPVIGSSPGNPIGNLFAVNPQVQLATGATDYVSLMGGEVDVTMSPGSSAQYKWGWCLSTTGDDVGHGSLAEAALHIGAVPSSGGWNNGIVFSRFNGNGAPVSTTGTLISTYLPNVPWGNNFTVLHGIDLRGITMTGFAFAFGPNVSAPVFSISGSGNVNGQNAAFSTLHVTGATELQNVTLQNLAVVGATALNTVSVAGNLSVTGNTSDAGNINASNGGFATLSISGASTLAGAHFTGAVAMDQGLNVTGYVVTGQGLSVGGLINLPPMSAPSAPSSGFDIFVDQADGKLKVKSSSGTVTVLALP